ncbi:small ribosomal subunit protein mS31 [Procambarus clarkii]|uniref:small ribosomal subunit protein mS31 n=1 Tax=Procambarus clarkii TaxID=6728 RepID=UPI001E675CD6|nr:28S ribosomal protein S31, mitochondrial-like [Procambarus clarkii]
MAAALRPRAAQALRVVLNGYGFRPWHQTRAFCKIPPDDAKPVEEIQKSQTEKQQEQTGDINKTALRTEESLNEGKLEIAQSSEKLLTEVKQDRSLHKMVSSTIDKDHSQDNKQDATQKMEVPYEEDKIDHSVDTIATGQKIEEALTGVKQETKDEILPQKGEKVVTEKGQIAAQVSEESIVEKKEENVVDKGTAAKKKLNDLLTSLATAEIIPVEPTLKLSRPKARQKKKDKSKEPAQAADPLIGSELLSATKEVAENLGGDTKATESELLSALRSHAANELPDEKPVALSDLLVGMKVERKQSKSVREFPRPKRYDREHEASQRGSRDGAQDQRRWQRTTSKSEPRTLAPVDLFGTECLGIFSKEPSKERKSMAEAAPLLPVWETTHQREVQQSVSHPPENAFVEMIQWTKQGKLWTFPIDNEVGLEEEKSVGFHEHVFLERHLEGWCPPRGPIRNFMELVCTGLSKNPYITVERKHAHIQWYKNYFAEKEQLLKELGAIESSPKLGKENTV